MSQHTDSDKDFENTLDNDFRNMFENPTTNQESEKWLKAMRNKLYSMFCSPMKEEYTREAFKWVSQLCLTTGDFSWCLLDENCSQEEVKVFSCISRLSLNEIHILIPLVQRHLTCGDEPELEDGKVLARSANSSDYDQLGSHLVIIESVIKTLVKGQRFDDDLANTDDDNKLIEAMKSHELINLLERLKEVIFITCEYLELVNEHWIQLSNKQGGEQLSSAIGAVRLVAVWLCEDPCGLKPQCDRFLISLIIKILLKSAGPTIDDLLILALHSICSDDDDLMIRLRQTVNYKDALEKYLNHVQLERSKLTEKTRGRGEKMFKLRCGMIKDLIKLGSEDT